MNDAIRQAAEAVAIEWSEYDGLVANRDHVSAQVILQRAGIPPLDANVEELISCVA